MSNRNLKNYDLSFSIVFLSLMLIFSYLEAIIPFNVSGIGIKVGLSNIISIVSIKIQGPKKCLILNVLRLIIIGVLFGNILRFALSVSGFIFSFIIMVIMLKILNFSIITSSVFGGVFHNIGQIFALAIINKNLSIFLISPAYILVGIITGLFIGILTQVIYDKLVIYNNL